jgi:spore maturation protein CgeB
MSYRFIKIAPVNRTFLNLFYSRYERELPELNYAGHLEKLFKECFGWANFFKLNLSELGVEAEEIISNDRVLQNKWAVENFSAQTGFLLIIDQLKKFRPDVVFVQDVGNINGSMVDLIREEVPSVKLIIGWRCSPYSRELFKSFRSFDCFFTCSEQFHEDFSSNGLKSFIMRHAFESSILDKIKENSFPETDLLFIGSLLSSSDFHDYRISLIEDLIKSDAGNIALHTDINIDSFGSLLMKKSLYVFFHRMSELGITNFGKLNSLRNKLLQLNEMPRNPNFSNKFLSAIKEPLYGIDMYKASSKAKINLNVHAGVAGDYAANMRLFEATGVGSCLITDWKKNINTLYEPDKEVVVFKTKDEFLEKIKWLLSHPRERAEIAKLGQERTLRDHNLKNRLIIMDQTIKRLLQK